VNVILRRSQLVLARGDREWPLNERQIPNSRVVREAPNTGLQPCRGKSEGVAKRPRERFATRNLTVYDSQLLHRCTGEVDSLGQRGAAAEEGAGAEGKAGPHSLSLSTQTHGSGHWRL
jgi:hypothetical protein